jgi:hypothetical protein
MNTPIVFAKKAKKKEKRPVLRKIKPSEKRICNSESPLFYSVFMKSWLLEPFDEYGPRIYTELSPYNLSFQDRYSRVLYFNKLNELEKIFLEKKIVDSTKQYCDTQLDCLKAFRANQKLRWSFKKLFLAWKNKKFHLVNDTDIITMEHLKKPIFIYDYKTQKKYQIEAKSFLVDSLNRFLIHDDFFPKSKLPRNLYTNEELTFSQIWSVSMQLKKYGLTNWCWEAFVKSSFSVNTFLTDFEIPIKYEMVKRCFDDATSLDAKWFISELVLANTEGVTAKLIKWGIYNKVSHNYILKWRDICQQYWKIAVLKGEWEAENTDYIKIRISTLLEDEASIEELKTLYFSSKVKA